MKGIVDYRFGTLTWPDGDSYVGAWEGGLRQGWGAYYWNNGNSYQVGNFQYKQNINPMKTDHNRHHLNCNNH